MRFAIYKSGALHAVVASPEGEKVDRALYAESLRSLNVADSVVPIESDEHEAILRANAGTAERIAAGFDFRGQRISLSLASQITISNAYTIRNSLQYPLSWANAEDTGFVTMESAKDIEALYAAATMAVLLARTEGNARKAAVLAEGA